MNPTDHLEDIINTARDSYLEQWKKMNVPTNDATERAYISGWIQSELLKTLKEIERLENEIQDIKSNR